MKPERESLRLFGVTRAKGKMYEFGIPESAHLRMRPDDEPASLLLLAVATLGDVAALIAERDGAHDADPGELEFAASYFDALLSSRLAEDLDDDVSLLAAAAYYLAGRPGSSHVIAERLANRRTSSPVEGLLLWILRGGASIGDLSEGPHRDLALDVQELTQAHFTEGRDPRRAREAARRLQELVRASPSARDFLFADLVLAVLCRKLEASTWVALPLMSGLTKDDWRSAIRSPHFPDELWPAQLQIGARGLFAGRSGIIQMPTSAGKTRSLEMVLRAGMLSGRVRVAVIVAPFRALSQEIATSMRRAFQREGNVSVNELSDVIEDDFGIHFAAQQGGEVAADSRLSLLVLTPEKLQYVLRKHPEFVGSINVLVYDEAHQFDSGGRGITYELLVTEVRAALPVDAQVVAISAVMRNAAALKDWLLGDEGVVVDGSDLSPTARATAFATWMERRGQLQFFENSRYDTPDYFVPRVIESHVLERRGKETKIRQFPDQDKDLIAGDVALHLGLRLFPQGAVAVFAGTKATATKLARRVVEVFDRGWPGADPAGDSDSREVAALMRLASLHFGEASTQARAAGLGVSVHHGNTPNGLRVATEYAMQHQLVRFVICTSTLAQGVNLPIRYLIVTSAKQGQRPISVRDFQNLLGRAGRAGMYTEGLVIFADPRTYDHRGNDPWKFNQVTRLLDPSNAEDTTSSILWLVQSFTVGGAGRPITSGEMTELLFAEPTVLKQWEEAFPGVQKEVTERRGLFPALESFLMAKRSASSLEDFRIEVLSLCESTFAYAIASEAERESLKRLFVQLAESTSEQVPERSLQNAFGRTLLSALRARRVHEWVDANRAVLLTTATNGELFELLWPLLLASFEDGFPATLEPPGSAHALSRAWVDGASYSEIFDLAAAEGMTKPYGSMRRRRLSEDDIIDFLHSTLAYDSALVVAAVCEFVGPDVAGGASSLGLFLKSVKYGLPHQLQVSAYEYGFADRALARLLEERLVSAGYSGDDLLEAMMVFPTVVRQVVSEMPTYFSAVLEGILGDPEVLQ